MEYKETTVKTVDAILYLKELPGTGYSSAIRRACAEMRITKEFVDAFRDEITKEMFSKSPLLSGEMIEEFPDLFDKEIWKANSIKSPDLLKNKKFRKSLTIHDIRDLLEESKKIGIDDSLFTLLYNEYPALREYLSSQYAASTPLRILEDNLDDMDESVFKSKYIKNDSNTMKIEKLIKRKKDLTCQFFIAGILTHCEDVGWQKRMLAEAKSSHICIKYDKSGKSMDGLLRQAMRNANVDIVKDILLLINEFSADSFTKHILAEVMQSDVLDDATASKLVDVFKNVGLAKELREMASVSMMPNTLLAVGGNSNDSGEEELIDLF